MHARHVLSRSNYLWVGIRADLSRKWGGSSFGKFRGRLAFVLPRYINCIGKNSPTIAITKVSVIFLLFGSPLILLSYCYFTYRHMYELGVWSALSTSTGRILCIFMHLSMSVRKESETYQMAEFHIVLTLNLATLNFGTFYCNLTIFWIIIYMKKFLRTDWLRACQLIPNSAKTWNFLSAERRN